MCQIDTGSGCWGYMCNECQEEWNKDRADRDALREALRRGTTEGWDGLAWAAEARRALAASEGGDRG